MITITRQRRSGAKHEYVIYEPGDVLPHSIRVVPYRNRRQAMRGEYVTDINGRMVPLLRRIDIRKRNQVMFIFPGFTWQPWVQDIFSYPIDKAQEPDQPRYLTPKLMAMAALVNSGMDVDLAVMKLWPRSGKRQIAMIARRAFGNQEFIHYLLVELGFVNKLKEALEARGMSMDTIADEIQELATSKKANPTLKKWALETALEALGDKDKGQAPLPQLPAPGLTLEAIMAARISQSLPETTAKVGAIERGSPLPDLLNDITEAGNAEIKGVDLGFEEGD